MSASTVRLAMRGGLVGLAVAGLVACGGNDAPEGASGPGAAGGQAQAPAPGGPGSAGPNEVPEVVAVYIEPSAPVGGNEVRADVEGDDLDGDSLRYEYRWRSGDRQLGQGKTVTLPDLEKGQVVSVTVIASDGKARSEPFTAEVEVGNQPPRLFAVLIEASGPPVRGTPLVATPEAVDPDGDEVEFEYQWIVNGDAYASEAETLETDGLERGSTIEVEVTASDGYARTDPVRSEPVRLGNSPPKIVSEPVWSQDGGTFRYSVEARDPDGDVTLRYRLKKGPQGMRIDNISGEVVWQPRTDQAGRHDVEVEVDDLNGGVGMQTFEVVMDVETLEPAANESAARPGLGDDLEDVDDFDQPAASDDGF